MNKKERLKTRAAEFAKPVSIKDDSESSEFLLFTLSNEQYAIQTSFIEEVYSIKNITEIPFTPNFIKGVINVRGHIYSIVDLTNFFNLKQVEEENKIQKAIILKNNIMEFGLLIYRLDGVTKIKKSDMSDLPSGVSDHTKKYISSVTKDNIIILDTEKLLLDEKMKIYQEI